MFEGIKNQRKKQLFKKTNEEEKNTASENRKNGEKIASALCSAATKATGISGLEASTMFCEKSKRLADKIRSSKTSGYCDLSKIDSLLKKVVDEYGNALACGDAVCAKKAGEMINDIIDERAKLADCQKEDAEDEAVKVEELAQGTYTLMKYYNSMRINKNNAANSLANMKEFEKRYNDQKEKTKNMILKDPKAEELVKSYIPGQTQLTPAAKSIIRAKELARTYYKSRETARISNNTMVKQSEILGLYIQELGLILEQRDSRLSAEEIENTAAILDKYSAMLNGINDQTSQLNDLADHFEQMLYAIDNDIEDDNRGIEIDAWFDKMLKMEEEQEASYEEGRRLAQQQEAEQANNHRIANEN